jgi:hypothetical protein
MGSRWFDGSTVAGPSGRAVGVAGLAMLEPVGCMASKAIKNGGLFISEQQEVRPCVTHRQAWWRVPGPPDDMTVPG